MHHVLHQTPRHRHRTDLKPNAKAQAPFPLLCIVLAVPPMNLLCIGYSGPLLSNMLHNMQQFQALLNIDESTYSGIMQSTRKTVHQRFQNTHLKHASQHAAVPSTTQCGKIYRAEIIRLHVEHKTDSGEGLNSQPKSSPGEVKSTCEWITSSRLALHTGCPLCRNSEACVIR